MLSRLISRFIALFLATIVIIATPQPSVAQKWLPWVLQGLQVIQLATLSDRQEVQLGRQINQQLFASRKMRVSRNRKLQRKVNQIGQQLVKTSSRPGIPYTFQVIEDQAVNAFATMGGFVYINTGLIATAENEAELASVVAHEIAHIASRHALNQMRNVAVSQGLMSAAGVEENQMVQLGVQLAVNLPHSREAELEADQLGLKNLTEAGYAPIAMVNFMKKLAAQGKGNITLLSTHPDTNQRVIALQNSLDPSTATQGYGLNSQAYQREFR
ncbi:MAG: M48 family metallopeptidase [Microcystaceae cyanobacterium]